MGVIGNKSRTGMTNSPEMRANISKGLLGNKCGLGNKSRKGQKRSQDEIQKGRETRKARYPNGFHHTEETKCKIAEAHRGGKKSPEEIKRRLDTIKGKYPDGLPVSLKTREKISKAGKGRRHTAETKAKISAKHMGKVTSEETKAKLSKYWSKRKDEVVARGKKAWENPEKVAKMIANMLKARHRRPNKLEESFQVFLGRNFPNEWRYVGNGSFILGGKCPDFVNVNGRKQIIEIFGDYWHQGENEDDRIKVFAEFGYDTLVLWESEIKSASEEELAARVREFCRR
jgi:very-short-patch-repair endonuclease